MNKAFIWKELIMRIGTGVVQTRKHRRVFVLDDNEVNRIVLQSMLTGDNEVHEFASVDAALGKGLQWRPDLVLISALLVAREGRELLLQLRATWAGVKLVVICEAADDDCRTAALAAGADDCLARPFMMESVRQLVESHIVRNDESRAVEAIA